MRQQRQHVETDGSSVYAARSSGARGPNFNVQSSCDRRCRAEGTGMDAKPDKYRTPLPVQGADCSHSALSSCNSLSGDFQSFLENQFQDDEVASVEPATSLALASNTSGRPPRPDLPAGAVARAVRRKLRNRVSQRQWRTRQKVRSIYNLHVSLAQLSAIVQARLTEAVYGMCKSVPSHCYALQTRADDLEAQIEAKSEQFEVLQARQRQLEAQNAMLEDATPQASDTDAQHIYTLVG